MILSYHYKKISTYEEKIIKWSEFFIPFNEYTIVKSNIAGPIGSDSSCYITTIIYYPSPVFGDKSEIKRQMENQAPDASIDKRYLSTGYGEDYYLVKYTDGPLEYLYFLCG
jgi:hypothetical protein